MIVDTYPFFATWSAQIRPAGFGSYDAAYLPSRTAGPTECQQRIVEGFLFVCWGSIARDTLWIEHVVQAIQTNVAPYPDLWYCSTTKSGASRHPSLARDQHRIPPGQKPILWRAAHA